MNTVYKIECNKMIKTSTLWQFYASFASGFGCLVLAVLAVWSSYTSPLYSSNSTTLLNTPMTKFEESLLGSFPSLGSMVGTAIAASVLDKYGRRNGGILLSLPYLISWVVIGISSSINVILVARFLGGISGGGALVFAPVVVSEVSEDSIRGFLASVSMFQYSMGMLLSYIMGWCFSYKGVIWINIAISVGGIGLVVFMEETPAYLVKKKQYERARLSIARYRGVPASSMVVTEELLRLKQTIISTADPRAVQGTATKAEEAEKLNYQDLQLQKNQVDSSLKMLFLSLSSRRAFYTIAILMTLMSFMGMIPMQVYANIVFNETDPSRTDLFTVIFAAVQFIATVITSVAADRFGRRVLQIGSSIIVALCLIALGYTLQFDVAPSEVTVILLMMYSFFFMLGVGSVAYVLLAEIFAPEVINCGSMLVIEWMWLLNFVVIAVFPYVTDLVGFYGAFYGFGIVSCINAIVSYCILPETAGLSNEEIQQAFLGRQKNVEVS